ncbi:related to Rpa43 - 43 kD subunit of DNA-directed RNA polymerase I [Melanopsichium pennsylvanicum]|uniref:Related to Rpa43 - 43 kD subunit of DNA-directed RNA polymerase I n=2 Tax=Melanopsichium pennsylvanicum TaxID=63383 RepID=A0AAJ4XHN3_9BASI|nr:related to Rpa43-43 kD subunit of DNA-directed RNA polymerase I [Melanopsichium pennsylvanicum 4]SNX82749.1 related to Rpa43 - 43 kD subunit of DNA-directed RNA polymerase I [Melanopsichium pennsylvanicum]
MSKDKTKSSKDKKSKSSSSSSSKSKKSRKSTSTTSTTSTTSISDLPLTLANDGASTSTTSTSSRTVTSAFVTMYPVLNLPIPPVWSNDPYSAFSDLMDTLVMRYVPQLSGVLITHSPTRFLQDTALFSADSAFATASVGFECVVWRPIIGQVLEGTICLSSPSHVSLLLYGLFNASIPASHLPEEEWEFVLNDESEIIASTDHGLGHWKNKADGTKLGGSTGKLSFTVISLTIANHMLSLHGSLLPEPFKGPPPTLDRSYLKKSLLPSQALGLGTAGSKQQRSRFTPSSAVATGGDMIGGGSEVGSETEAVATPPPAPRRVRWQDEDESPTAPEIAQNVVVDDDDDDLKMLTTPASVVKPEVVVKTKSPKSSSNKSKRKSISGVTDEAEDLATPSQKREKKRRKEAIK